MPSLPLHCPNCGLIDHSCEDFTTELYENHAQVAGLNSQETDEFESLMRDYEAAQSSQPGTLPHFDAMDWEPSGTYI